MDCPRITCGHAADKHKTRPGGKTSYCISCAISREKGHRTQNLICDRSPESITDVHQLIDELADTLSDERHAISA